jgi:predicted double-glycine peptidase
MPKKTHRARVRAPKKIRYVDAFAMRNLYPDFDVLEEFSPSLQHGKSAPQPYIPKNEIWIDRAFKKETPFLLRVRRAEKKLRSRAGRGRLSEKKLLEVRAALERQFATPGRVPPFVIRSKKMGTLTVRSVRGEIIRRHVDPWFVFGGHDLVYDYVPKNEVWIDARQDPRDVPFTFFHELHERKSMARGLDYPHAHALASEAERVLRTKRRAAHDNGPLVMTPFRQRPGYCAPACIKIVCSHFGREYDEHFLGTLCGTTSAEGTYHADLVRVAKMLGANVRAGANGTVADLRRLILKERLPVIVGWYSPSNPRKWKFDPYKDPLDDHFSVVYHLTRTHVFMMDPELNNGRRKIRIARFLKLWWDTDTPRNGRVNRWYLAMRFDGRKF